MLLALAAGFDGGAGEVDQLELGVEIQFRSAGGCCAAPLLLAVKSGCEPTPGRLAWACDCVTLPA